MNPEVSEYLRQINVALEEHNEQRVFDAVAGLIESKPVDAALLIWAEFFPADNIYFRRVLAYAMAKTAAGRSRYLWGPLATFVVSPYTDDEATLVNILSALQIFDEHDEILSAILAPEFGAFVMHCIASSDLVVDALCDLIPHLMDRGLLLRLLSRAQVRVVRPQLNAVAEGDRPIDKGGALAILRVNAFAETLPDATSRLDEEGEVLLRQPPTELGDSVVSLLRSVLANARSSYALRKQAEEIGGAVQEIRLTGSEPIKGRVTLEVFERLIHSWRTAIRAVMESRAPTADSAITTYMLAPAQGSFVMRFLVASPRYQALLQSLEEITELAEKPEELSSRTQLTPEARSSVVKFVEALAEKDLDAVVGVVDPRLFERPRRRIVSSKLLPVIREIEARKEEKSTPHQFLATLEGANHRLGTFDALGEELSVRGETPHNRRSMLLDKVIGRRYNFAVEERVTTSGTGDEKRLWILESVSDVEEEGTSAAEEVPEDLKQLSTANVPQQDRLDRVVDVVRLLANGKDLQPRALAMRDSASSLRHIDYMRHAAKVLGLVAEDGIATEAGRTLAQLPESRVLDFLSVRFELSVVARLWKKWSKAADLHQLDENLAVEFLLDSGFSVSMAERRGRTLRKWLLAFKSAGRRANLEEGPRLPINRRARKRGAGAARRLGR